jgi:hypothetical protein
MKNKTTKTALFSATKFMMIAIIYMAFRRLLISISYKISCKAGTPFLHRKLN